MTGRKKFARPQGMLWADNPGTSTGGLYIPDGYEVGAIVPTNTDPLLIDQFIILSDHNRSPIDIRPVRLEKRERMINGRMRSHHIADKLTMNISWDLLPSRSYSKFPGFDVSGLPTDFTTSVDHDSDEDTPNRNANLSGSPYIDDQQFTVDGGAGGNDLLQWYQNHQGPFWVYLAYDKYINYASNDPEKYSKINQYNEIVQMYISDFSYSIVKRGGLNHDFWNISVSLEEV
jgi:hypothetical protein